MNEHTATRLLLYDYLEGSLEEEPRASVDDHLATCSACTEALERLREAVALTARPKQPASEERSAAFWAGFAASVEDRIRERQEKKAWLSNIWETVHSYLFFHRGSFSLAGMGAAMILLVIVLVNRPSPSREVLFVDSSKSTSIPLEPRNETARNLESEPSILTKETPEVRRASASAEQPLRVRYADNRISQYIRKSKVLLIGIANLETDSGQPVDLTVERKASRELVREARYLKQRPLDPRAEQLVEALNRILIELANMAENNQAPNVEIVRSGIQQENLLFKIRMAEAALDSARFVTTKGKPL
jgi:hypothetical protein